MAQVLGYTYVIEFQKRGLPHAHMLLILGDAPRTPDEYDKYVCAELSDASDFKLMNKLLLMFLDFTENAHSNKKKLMI